MGRQYARVSTSPLRTIYMPLHYYKFFPRSTDPCHGPEESSATLQWTGSPPQVAFASIATTATGLRGADRQGSIQTWHDVCVAFNRGVLLPSTQTYWLFDPIAEFCVTTGLSLLLFSATPVLHQTPCLAFGTAYPEAKSHHRRRERLV